MRRKAASNVHHDHRIMLLLVTMRGSLTELTFAGVWTLANGGEAMKNKAPKALDLRPVYAVTVLVLIALAVLIWIVATPLYH